MEIHSFALEQLEGRALCSVVTPMDAGSASVAAAQPALYRAATSHNPLSGPFNVAGTYSQPVGNPDIGPQYNFNGKGRKNPLGKFTMTGHVQTPGFINNGRSTGKM